jgi:hypothetical protein
MAGQPRGTWATRQVSEAGTFRYKPDVTDQGDHGWLFHFNRLGQFPYAGRTQLSRDCPRLQ